MKDELAPSASDSGRYIGECTERDAVSSGSRTKRIATQREARSWGEPRGKIGLQRNYFEEIERLREERRKEGREGGKQMRERDRYTDRTDDRPCDP